MSSSPRPRHSRAPILRAFLAALPVAGALAAGALAAGAGPAGAQSAGERIVDYTVALVLDADGDLLVDESITYDFGSEARHGIIRDLVRRERYDDRYDRVYEIADLRVAASEGTPAQYETSAGGDHLHVKIGDPDRTITGRHRYDISYRVQGAPTAFAAHDELNWDAIGHEWPVPIEHASVTVHAPAAIDRTACFSGPQGSTLACAGTTLDGPLATFESPSLAGFAGMTVVVGLPAGTISPRPEPHLVERWSADRAFTRDAPRLALAGAVAVTGLAAVGLVAWRTGRDRRFAGSAVDAAMGSASGVEERIRPFDRDAGPVEFVPPDGIRPGQVGTLLDEVADLRDVTATIVDLAVRGRLTIVELAPEGFIRRRNDYELHRTEGGKGPLSAYEQALLDALFRRSDTVTLSDLKYEFHAELVEVQRALYEDTVMQGWYRAHPDRTRLVWRIGGFAVAAAGIGLTVAAARFSTFGIVPLGLVVAGLLLAALAGRMPARTGKGSAMLSRVRGFRRLFDEGEEDVRARFAEEQGIFSQYLPFAIVFGCADRWARAFEGLDDVQLGTTGWYSGHDGQHLGAFGIATAMERFDTQATGTLYASRPSSSSGSGFSGGSSGGGGGGGGGSSW